MEGSLLMENILEPLQKSYEALKAENNESNQKAFFESSLAAMPMILEEIEALKSISKIKAQSNNDQITAQPLGTEVMHWDCYESNENLDGNKYRVSIENNLVASGQMDVGFTNIEGELCLGALFEVNNIRYKDNSISGALPCIHFYLNEGTLGFSIFKEADVIYLRPEGNITLMKHEDDGVGFVISAA